MCWSARLSCSNTAASIPTQLTQQQLLNYVIYIIKYMTNTVYLVFAAT